MMPFDEKDSKAIQIETAEKSKNLLVSFGGIRQGLGIPVFEFFKSLSLLSCTKIFIRDFYQAWYHLGVDEQINSMGALENYLRKFIANGQYEKICFLGNSMGGYAAVLFGTRLRVDKVLAFSPQSFIDRKNRILYRDFRWKDEIKNMRRSRVNTEDLKNTLKFTPPDTTKIDVYFSRNHRLDRIHAKRLTGITNVSIYPKDENGHNLVKNMRSSGELEKILFGVF